MSFEKFEYTRRNRCVGRNEETSSYVRGDKR